MVVGDSSATSKSCVLPNKCPLLIHAETVPYGTGLSITRGLFEGKQLAKVMNPYFDLTKPFEVVSGF